MGALTVRPYRIELGLPEWETSGSSKKKDTGAAQGELEYLYNVSMHKSPEAGEEILYRFLIPHAVTPPEENPLLRTLSVEILFRLSQETLWIRDRGNEPGVMFDVLSVLQSSPRSPEVPVTKYNRGGQLSWTVTRGPRHPLSMKVKVTVASNLLRPSAQRVFMCAEEKVEALSKVSLLEEAPATGDLNLICKDGSKVPAHAAVLAGIPYFQSKLKNDWSGADWNMHKRLDVHLPCPVDEKVVGAFLKFAYGDAASSLNQLEPSEAPLMQGLFSLAESTDFTSLCESVKDHVQVTEGNAASWLTWLSKEHGPIARKISNQVRRVVKRVVKRSFE
ncbi:hypothetical protein KFL_000720130 [Klebsormidium nitens]|uniref:BTB domain-containing protein n=1 Tax=Klebsormidium nitens TaxID=105231 RepID=A0A1Y1HR77_KLENI|nr:hypothetical protein KFL_000720130 [Klebsormidium nitens]|eukprot:GAQ81144.1 hypothetical protein KFL_000720130 [Klebsormidium nitens]